jgi:hypothetical protein
MNSNSTRQNEMLYILDVRKRLSSVMSLAKDHAENKCVNSKVWYDRKARIRSLEPGQQVLALLPLPSKPLQMKYYGPYVILEKLGPVDYRIARPTKN